MPELHRPTPPLRSMAAWLFLLLPLACGLSFDLITKHLAFALEPAGLVTAYSADEFGRTEVLSREARPVPYIVHLHAHVNYGAVFGIGQGQRLIFVIVSAAAIGLLGYLFARSGSQRLYQFLLGLLFAGVLGNLYDRVVFGYVRDMIYAFPNARWSDLMRALPDVELFPWIFNIADSMLCTGVALMFVYTVFRPDNAAGDTRTMSPPTDSSVETALK